MACAEKAVHLRDSRFLAMNSQIISKMLTNDYSGAMIMAGGRLQAC